MSAPVIREVDGRLVLKGCDPNAMHEVQGQVLIDLVGRCNALREPPTIVSRDEQTPAQAAVELPFTQSNVFVRATHPHSFRTGQWASLLGVRYLPARHGLSPKQGRACLLVEFVDQVKDLWPLDDPTAGYEFKGGRV